MFLGAKRKKEDGLHLQQSEKKTYRFKKCPLPCF